MLAGDFIGHGGGLLVGIDQDDAAVIPPGGARDLGGRKHRELALDLGRDRGGERGRAGDQRGRRGRAVLGLAEKVGDHHFSIRGLIGDHQDFGRPGEQVDAHPAVELALGFGDIGVAGSDQHVHRGDRAGAERHRADRLDAAQNVDLVGAGERHRGHGLGVRGAVGRRGAGGDPLDARDLGRDHAHMRRRHHRVAPARDIAADAAHRDIAMAQRDARHRLDLDIRHRFALDAGEVADLGLGEGDVLDDAGRHRGDQRVDLPGAEAKALRRPVVEFLRQRADRRVAASLDIGEDVLDRLADRAVVGAPIRRAPRVFQDPGHRDYLIAIGLRGEPTALVIGSGGAQKKNS